MDGKKVYQIQINGITESVNAVEALNKQLDALDARIKTLQSKSVNVGTGGGTKSSSNASSLSEEAKLEKQITQIDEKRKAYSKEIYQNYLAAQDVLKETVNDQKQIAAQERLQAKTYGNTMAGLKQELADIKTVMQTTDLGDNKFQEMTKRAGELTNKLKELEQSYGVFGRNVGNYSSAFDGMQKLTITVGGVAREFNSAREASKTLKNELIGLEAAGSGNTEVAKELRSEYYKLTSAMDDAMKSSKAMDNAMDVMESFTAMASVGQGLKGFFGFDESEIQRSIQKLVSLQNVLQGIEKLKKQMETGEGFGNIFGEGSKAVDSFVSKLTGANVGINGLTMGSRAATVAVRTLSTALKGIGIGLIIGAITIAVDAIEKLVRSLDTTKTREEALEREVKSLNRQYELRKDLLAGSFMSGAINTEEFLKEQYKLENEYIEKQINLLQQRADILNEKSWWQSTKEFFTSGEAGTGFTGNKFNGKATVSSWNQIGSFSYDVSSIEEAEEAWKKLNKAVDEGKDYFSKYENSLSDWFDSLFTTVEETKDAMKGMGNIVLSNTIGEFEELNQKFKEGEISAEDFAKELKVLTDRMNSSEVLNSVIANLDEYIPDDAVREKVQNILTYIGRLNDEFNAVSESQIHHWNQVRIDAMAEGSAKIAAQMAEDERHEIAQYGHTQEQITLIQKKYQRKRLDETKKHNKKVSSEAKKNAKEQLEAEKDLANLRIANMKEGLNKVLKQLEEERKQKLAKVEADGRLIGERQAEINKLYDKKIIDAKREWTEKVEQAYKNMWDNIYAYSLESMQKIAENISKSLDIQRSDLEFGRNTKGAPYRMSPENSSYGIQGTNQLSKGTQIELQLQEQNNKKLRDTYNERLELIEEYWKARIDFETSAANNNYIAQIALENESYQAELRNAAKHAEDLHKELEKNLREGIITREQYDEIEERNISEHATRVEALEHEHKNKLKELEIEKVNALQNINAEYYRNRLQELRDFQTAIANLEAKQPVYDKYGWGIINLSETNKNNENLLESYRKLANEIVTLKRKLQDQLDKNEISFDDFQQANRELDAFADNVGQKMDEVKYKLSIGAQIGEIIQSINGYVQQGLQAIQTIMNAFEDYQDYQFEKEQDTLDKENEMLEKALDKQQEIVEQHKNAIDDIESELATARGDRRQHLIDQLNAEIAAERAAQKEKQKIEKQQKAAEKKQEELDKKRKEAEYKRNLLSIIVSTAMATANGLATQPFWPVGVAMGALATTLGMVQYALAAKSKPYAHGGQLDGGVAQGPRHSQGGIKVLGGRAEIEGGEFITNRKSTASNIDLLEYINSKKTRVDLSDLLEFYNGNTIKKTIRSVRTRFEDGGYVPTLPNELDIKDQLQNIVVNQDNRPVVVSVVDINNKQEDVRRVQTLAGL
jgi:hypothetical protein